MLFIKERFERVVVSSILARKRKTSTKENVPILIFINLFEESEELRR